MTGTNIKDQVEKILRDTGNTYWSEADILSSYNEFQKDFAKNVQIFEKRADLSVSDASKGLYTLPSDLIRIKRIHTTAATMEPVTTKELDYIDQDWESYPQGTPVYYYLDGLGLTTLGLYPRE